MSEDRFVVVCMAIIIGCGIFWAAYFLAAWLDWIRDRD